MRDLASRAGRGGEGEGGIEVLRDRAEIEWVLGTGGATGEWGYVNWRSGWADAEAAMRFARRKVEDTERVRFRTGTAKRLLFHNCRKVVGVELDDGETLRAELVILAAGAWSGTLVDLRGRVTATGQVLAYMALTGEEQRRLEGMPVVLNTSSGMFVIPPRERVLRIARHGVGYANPRRVVHPKPDSHISGNEMITISAPPHVRPAPLDSASMVLPLEAQTACLHAVRTILPSLCPSPTQPFIRSRICYYTDTPTADFLITYHPSFEGLFLATGGSGHGFKFLPVIGEKIVDCLEGVLEEGLKYLWRWREEPVNGEWWSEDGSRGGKLGTTLEAEMERGREGSKL